jgi:hypothetical protein
MAFIALTPKSSAGSKIDVVDRRDGLIIERRVASVLLFTLSLQISNPKERIRNNLSNGKRQAKSKELSSNTSEVTYSSPTRKGVPIDKVYWIFVPKRRRKLTFSPSKTAALVKTDR